MNAHSASDVIEHLRALGVSPRGVSADSRALVPGDLFVAYPGARTDGRRYIGDAVARGVSAVAWDAEGFRWDPAWAVPNVPVTNLQATAGELAHAIYGRPSAALHVIAVTGTNGKTSVSQWIARALGTLGCRSGVAGTLGAGFPGALDESANTTPDAVSLHRLFARLRDQGARAAAIEASSIGLDQDRLNGVQVEVAVLTNLTRDHLDYHGSMEAYAEAKRRLFARPGLRAAVLNLDDPFGRELAAKLRGRGMRCIGYTLREGACETDLLLRAEAVALTAAGIRFTAVSAEGSARIQVPMVGAFNVSNLLAVLGALRALDVPLERAAAAVNGLTPPRGRMQLVGGEGQPLAVVDYAHTPDALEQALMALRPTVKARGGHLVCVFGCGGERDAGKRPLMGGIAARLADRVVLTSDNPRGEDPKVILDDIARGVGSTTVQRIADRAEAIGCAIAQAGEHDVVLIAGKGHENYQEVAGQRLPFSDFDHAAAALAARRGAQP